MINYLKNLFDNKNYSPCLSCVCIKCKKECVKKAWCLLGSEKCYKIKDICTHGKYIHKEEGDKNE